MASQMMSAGAAFAAAQAAHAAEGAPPVPMTAQPVPLVMPSNPAVVRPTILRHPALPALPHVSPAAPATAMQALLSAAQSSAAAPPAPPAVVPDNDWVSGTVLARRMGFQKFWDARRSAAFKDIQVLVGAATGISELVKKCRGGSRSIVHPALAAAILQRYPVRVARLACVKPRAECACAQEPIRRVRPPPQPVSPAGSQAAGVATPPPPAVEANIPSRGRRPRQRAPLPPDSDASQEDKGAGDHDDVDVVGMRPQTPAPPAPGDHNDGKTNDDDVVNAYDLKADRARFVSIMALIDKIARFCEHIALESKALQEQAAPSDVEQLLVELKGHVTMIVAKADRCTLQIVTAAKLASTVLDEKLYMLLRMAEVFDLPLVKSIITTGPPSPELYLTARTMRTRDLARGALEAIARFRDVLEPQPHAGGGGEQPPMKRARSGANATVEPQSQTTA